MSCSAGAIETIEHPNIHNDAVLYLLSLGRSSFGCFCVRLSAEQTGSVSGRQSAVQTGSVSGRQMEELYWKCFDEFYVIEGKFQTIKFFVIFVLEHTEVLKRNIFISH